MSRVLIVDVYNADVARAAGRRKALDASELTYDMKWTRAVKQNLAAGVRYTHEQGVVVPAAYRPFCTPLLHFNGRLVEVQYQQTRLFGENGDLENTVIVFTDAGSQKPFMVLACDHVFDYHFVGAASAASGISFFRYDEDGKRVDNITDWALKQFKDHYGKAPPTQPPPAGGRSEGKNSERRSEGMNSERGRSEGMNSLPRRGRAGEGEKPQHLFIPKPLPAALKSFARTLRTNATNAERLVWEMLRREQTGVKFRRQHPVEPYVLDFYCVERKLAIEIDGGQHNEAAGHVHDEKRSAVLTSRGIRVLRFWNNEVMENPEGVWDAIMAALEAPPPQPSPAGGGSNRDLPAGGGSNRDRPITKQAIFHYVYAVLHDPLYREKYAQNLKREFPRIPFYADFWCWAEWGRELMDLHIGYESIEPWPLQRHDVPDEKTRKNGAQPKAMLKADKDNGRIMLDSETTLAGIPVEAWAYKLGNRSALEWILDQYKEKKPKDPTIRAKFDTYRFADYKEKVIDLLARVTRVSVETQAIVVAMRSAAR